MKPQSLKPPNSSLRKASAFTIIIIFIALAALGLFLSPLLTIKLSPSQYLPSLSLSYSLPGYSPRAIDTEVSSKLEAALSRIEGVKGIQSESDNGSGFVRLEFDQHTDMDAARLDCSAILRQLWASMPEGLSYPNISQQRAEGKASRPFMAYTLKGEGSERTIEAYAEEQLKPALARIKGVATVGISGTSSMEWRLQYDQRLLQQMGISLNEIETAIHNYYRDEPLGLCLIEQEGAQEWMQLMLKGEKSTKGFDASAIFLKQKDGALIGLDKLLEVQRTEARKQSYYRIDGMNSIYVFLQAEEHANQLMLSKAIRAEMQRQSSKIPAGYEAVLNFDNSIEIGNELNKIYLRTALTLFILLAFISLITRNKRYIILIAISLVVNLCIAIALYYLLGIEIQLYSLAGIAISLNLIVDNSIVMAEHIRQRSNLSAFLAILAATLTTIGVLSIIFFLDDAVRLNLMDFAAVVVVNLLVSLLVALFFIPALAEKIGFAKRAKKNFRPANRRALRFSNCYKRQILFMKRYRYACYLLLVLAFGLPLSLLPERLEGKGYGAELYNKLIDTRSYRSKVKPSLEKYLGGSLGLFVKKSFKSHRFDRAESRPSLQIQSKLPNGYTIEQMNRLMIKLESYLSQFPEIQRFETFISSAKEASITVLFRKDVEAGPFPYRFKAELISMLQSLGAGYWGVYGLADQGFNNEGVGATGSYIVELRGYNYDELWQQSELFTLSLKENKRIGTVWVGSDPLQSDADYKEYILSLDKRKLALEELNSQSLYQALNEKFSSDSYLTNIVLGGNYEALKISSKQSKSEDLWSLLHSPIRIGQKSYLLSDFAELEQRQLPQRIVKKDQEYKLFLRFEYMGSQANGEKLLKSKIDAFAATLPMGYHISSDVSLKDWMTEESNYFPLLIIIGVIIFFTTAILFNSLRQPLAILFIIPISFIGIFLSFSLLAVPFDQGGFAAFVLISGITVNAAIYLVNEYNSLRRQRPKLSAVDAYVKAWNAKINPIFLTVVSSVLAFIPFMIGKDSQSFWLALAVGSIGGLLISIPGIFFFLPLFLLRKKEIAAPKNEC